MKRVLCMDHRITKDVYNENDIDDMIIECRNYPELKRAVLSELNGYGKNDVEDITWIINNGSAIDFKSLDSAVADIFIRCYNNASSVVFED